MISPRNFDCTQVTDLLDDYRRNEIEPYLRVLISEHLAECETCAAELQAREALAEAMRAALPTTSTPAHLPPAVRRAIVARPNPHSSNHRNTQLLPWMLAAAFVVTIGIAMMQVHTAQPLHSPTEIAAVTPNEPKAIRAIQANSNADMASPGMTPASVVPLKKKAAPASAAPMSQRSAPSAHNVQAKPQTAPVQGYAARVMEQNQRLMGAMPPSQQDNSVSAPALVQFARQSTKTMSMRSVLFAEVTSNTQAADSVTTPRLNATTDPRTTTPL